ncbi:hypothetical protein HK098_002205 [Nowakowskiella sp. JEL0407]|nr:hypothetical protein HK098_002205 [Nowakowskiella sp. JEL0407]
MNSKFGIQELATSVFSASLAMMSAGTIYTFSLYGPQLSSKLSYTQTQTAFIAQCGNYGIYLFGPVFGYLVDKYFSLDPAPVFWISSTLMFSGFSLIAISYQGYFPSPHFLLLAFFNFFVGIGCASAYHGSLATNLRNFEKKDHGIAIGIPVSAFGISAALMARIAIYYFTGNKNDSGDEEVSLDVGGLLLFLACFCGVANLITSFTLKNLHARNGVYGKISTEDDSFDDRTTATSSSYRRHTTYGSNLESRRLLDSDASVVEVEESKQQTQTNQIEEIDVTCFDKVDAWFLVIFMGCLTGIGLMHINNVGAIILSLFPAPLTSSDPKVQAAQNLHVTMISICNFLGRLVSGYLSDFCWRTYKLQRIYWSFVASGLLFLACLRGLYCNSIEELFTVTVLIGLGYGVVWTTVPVLVGEFFGSKRFAFHWGSMTLIPAFGGQLMSLYFGLVYDAHRDKQDPSLPCRGGECFTDSYLFATVLAILSIVASTTIYIRRYRMKLGIVESRRSD